MLVDDDWVVKYRKSTEEIRIFRVVQSGNTSSSDDDSSISGPVSPLSRSSLLLQGKHTRQVSLPSILDKRTRYEKCPADGMASTGNMTMSGSKKEQVCCRSMVELMDEEKLRLARRGGGGGEGGGGDGAKTRTVVE